MTQFTSRGEKNEVYLTSYLKDKDRGIIKTKIKVKGKTKQKSKEQIEAEIKRLLNPTTDAPWIYYNFLEYITIYRYKSSYSVEDTERNKILRGLEKIITTTGGLDEDILKTKKNTLVFTSVDKMQFNESEADQVHQAIKQRMNNIVIQVGNKYYVKETSRIGDVEGNRTIKYKDFSDFLIEANKNIGTKKLKLKYMERGVGDDFRTLIETTYRTERNLQLPVFYLEVIELYLRPMSEEGKLRGRLTASLAVLKSKLETV